ncbi:MAG: hypothetical protein SFZ23_09690 [Planctomycetota bacterium]|nr:hypothetical protein [Planctomycetota bacterium]
MQSATRTLTKSFLVCGVLGAACQAQVFTRITWQASLDDGASWTSDQAQIDNPDTHVRVRAILDWQHPDAYAFAFASFDGVVTSAGPSDSIVNIRRLDPFATSMQTLQTFRFGTTLKIDDARDPSPPALGGRQILIGQAPEVVGQPFSRDNPAPIFEYMLQLDGTPGARRVSHVFTTTPTEGPGTPVLFRNRQGTGGLLQPPSIIRPLDLIVVPAPPAAIAFLVLLPLAHSRRRVTR